MHNEHVAIVTVEDERATMQAYAPETASQLMFLDAPICGSTPTRLLQQEVSSLNESIAREKREVRCRLRLKSEQFLPVEK